MLNDQVEQHLRKKSYRKQYPTQSEIIKCPYCDSLHISLGKDKEKGTFQVYNGKIITRIVLYCEDCHRFKFKTVKLESLDDFKNE